jgi:hypothetical protein
MLNGESFTTGRARFDDNLADKPEETAKVYVKIRLDCPDGPLVVPAQLDTGAAWSMLESEIAEAMGLFDEPGEEIPISTRLGRVSGRLVRTHLTLLADQGRSLLVESTVFVSPDWVGPNFLGYSGLLDRVRIALDPGLGRNYFYFGLST